MRNCKIGRFIILLFGCFLVISNGLVMKQASACSRGETPSLEEQYTGAASIFTGTISEITDIYSDRKMVKIQPITAYKGDALKAVITNADSDQCGADFKVGESYLIYAQLLPNSSASSLQQKYVSIFDRSPIQEASESIQWLEQRGNVPSIKHLSGDYDIEAYDRSGLVFYYGKQYLGALQGSFIMNDSVYVPLHFFTETLGYKGNWNQDNQRIELKSKSQEESAVALSDITKEPKESWLGVEMKALSIHYDDLQVSIDGRVYPNLPEPFILKEQVYVPLRAVAEGLGLQVGWQAYWNAVFMNPPLLDTDPSLQLSMEYMINVGLEGTLKVDQLAANDITYRKFHGHQPEGYLPAKEIVPYSQMLVEEIGYRKYMPRFYISNEVQVVELMPTPGLIHRLETDAQFRELVGSKLGEAMHHVPIDRIITESHFE